MDHHLTTGTTRSYSTRWLLELTFTSTRYGDETSIFWCWNQGLTRSQFTFPENEWWCQSREIHHVDHFLLRADVISSPPFSFRSPGNETKLWVHESRLAYAQLQSQSQFSFVIAYLTFHFREKSMPRCFGKILETWKHIPLTLSLRKICPMCRPWSDGWSLNILPSWWVLRRRTSLFPDLVNAFSSNFKSKTRFIFGVNDRQVQILSTKLRVQWSPVPDRYGPSYLGGIYKIYFGCGW